MAEEKKKNTGKDFSLKDKMETGNNEQVGLVYSEVLLYFFLRAKLWISKLKPIEDSDSFALLLAFNCVWCERTTSVRLEIVSKNVGCWCFGVLQFLSLKGGVVVGFMEKGLACVFGLIF